MLRNYSESSRVVKKLEELTDKELLELGKTFHPHIGNDNIEFGGVSAFTLEEMLDGIDCHFGINENEEVFIEAEDYDDLEEVKKLVNRNSHLVGALDEVYEKVGPVKVECTMFPNFNHKGTESGSTVYSVMPYDRNKMGSLGAFMLGDVHLWRPSTKDYDLADENAVAIVKNRLAEADNGKWRIYSDNYGAMMQEGQINLSSFDPIFENDFKFAVALKTLDNPEGDPRRAVLEKLTQGLRGSIETCLRGIVDTTPSNFGGLNEESSVKGARLRVPMGEKSLVVEIENSKYQKMREKVYKSREMFTEMNNQYTTDLFKEVFQLNIHSNEHLAEMLDKRIKNFRSNNVGEARINHFITEFAKNNSKSDKRPSGEEIKEKAIEFIDKMQNLVAEFVEKYKDDDVDPDTKSKLAKMINKFKKEIALVKKLVQVKKYSGDDLAIYLLKAILAPKLIGRTDELTEMIDECGNVQSRANFPEPVVLFLAEAQPWTKIHDSMLCEAKKRLQNCGAKKVYVGVTGEGYEDYDPEKIGDGGLTDTTDQKNAPLSSDTRTVLLDAIYGDDEQVEVCKTPIRTDTLTDILETVFYRENKKVVGVVCPKNLQNAEVKKWSEGINEEQWRNNYCHELPVDKVRIYGLDECGFSESQARELVSSTDWDNWKDAVVPEGCSEKALKKYESIFETMSNNFRKYEDYSYRRNVKDIFWGNK